MTITQTAVMARRNLLHVLSDPQQLIGMTVQPLMFLLLFVYVFGGAISGSTRGYLQFVLPGLLVQGIGFGTTQTAVGLNADFQSGLIDRFRSLPMARSAVMAVHPHPRMFKTVRVVVQQRQRTTLRARVAVREGMVLVAADANHLVPVDVDENAADGSANPTEATDRLHISITYSQFSRGTIAFSRMAEQS